MKRRTFTAGQLSILPPVFTLSELARILCISTSTVSAWLNCRGLPGEFDQTRYRWRVNRDVLLAWLYQTRRIRTRPGEVIPRCQGAERG
jgi:hypothetical protein